VVEVEAAEEVEVVEEAGQEEIAITTLLLNQRQPHPKRETFQRQHPLLLLTTTILKTIPMGHLQKKVTGHQKTREDELLGAEVAVVEEVAVVDVEEEEDTKAGRMEGQMVPLLQRNKASLTVSQMRIPRRILRSRRPSTRIKWRHQTKATPFSKRRLSYKHSVILCHKR
jgi:hypothetical protein